VDVIPLRAYDNDSVRLLSICTAGGIVLNCAFKGKIVFAQNSQGQHFAIKVVKDNTDEYRILRFLSQMSQDVLKENCILPVLEFLPVPGFWFVVMPRYLFLLR
jgi:hypothetical protein